MDTTERQQVIDNEHLRLLRIGYLIAGGTSIFAGLIGLLYLGLGAFFGLALSGMTEMADMGGDEKIAEILPLIFIGIGGFLALVVGVLAALQLWTARSLQRRENRTLCLITAGITCLSLPWGTALGILTFYALNRDSIRREFEGQPPRPTSLEPGAVPPPPHRG